MERSWNRKMKVITIGSTKGGVGKSTIAANLAACYANVGKKVLIIDADPQGSSVSFRALREKNDIVCVSQTTNTICKDINQFNNFDIVIIDCGGRNSATFRSAILSAEHGILIIPIEASQYAVWGTSDTLEILEEARSFVDISAVFLFNKAPTGKSILKNETEKALKDLQEIANVKCFKTVLHQRADYAKSITEGKGVCEFNPNGKAAKEINELYKEVEDVLKGKGLER